MSLGILSRNGALGAQPSPRLTPDAVETQAEWWLASKAFFDGHIRESPTIPPPVNQHSRDDVPEYIYRRMVEQHNLLKELEDKIKAHKLMINQMNEDLQVNCNAIGRIPGPMKGTVYVGEHCGLSEFSGLQNTQGFTQDVMNRERRDSRPRIFFRSPYMLFPPTTVVPKKWTKKSRKKTSTVDISAFDLGNVVGDDNAQDDEVRITGARATGDFISFENVDPNKCTVAKSGTASLHPGTYIFLLQMDRHLRGTLDGSTCPYPSWDDVYWVYMPIHAGGDHWVTGAINLPHSTFLVLDSLSSHN
ncbi:phospholipase-like protein [Tanacetum coccineum]|uniref:Phospholipase-like protein n=1 Tax=Tanacetum coccineum TaxID=301880 RepID=A0ABQ4Z4H8_9ASTR